MKANNPPAPGNECPQQGMEHRHAPRSAQHMDNRRAAKDTRSVFSNNAQASGRCVAESRRIPLPISWCAALLLILVTSASVSNAQTGSPPTVKILIGFTRGLFVEMDSRDAAAALELFARELSKKSGMNYDAKMIVYDTPEELSTALRQEKFSMVCLPIMHHLSVASRSPLVPAIVPTHHGSGNEDRILIVNRNSGHKDLASLKQASLIFTASSRGELTHRWIDVELGRQKAPPADQFFGKVTKAKNDAQAIMSVFFQKDDAAIVSTRTLELMIEQNPQLGRDLVVVLRSNPFTYAVISFVPSVSREDREALTTVFMNMNTYPAGQQILRVFRHDGVRLFEAGDFASIRSLESEYQGIARGTARRRR